MSIRYYKLFDLLNRREMKKSDLRKVISSATIAKLSKGEYISGEAIEKICRFLQCQPGDIMEYLEEGEDTKTGQKVEIAVHTKDETAEPDNEINVYPAEQNPDLEEGYKKRLH